MTAAPINRPAKPDGDERPAGSVVAGRYRLDTPLGSGGMATVYRAKDLATGKDVAVKLLRRELSTIPEAASRFRREGELLQSFTHPGIVRVETFGALEDGTLFLAMELLEGETLGQLMRRRGALDPLEVGPILTGACAPLASAHAKGIVHRDLKPDNVFLARAPGAAELDVQVKLLDFGISKVFGSERLTQTGELLGTPRYMAPEQLAADHDLDGRVDVYALGVILYEMLAACPPFLGATPSDLIVAILHGKAAPLRAVRSDLPPEIESVVMRTMARAREARYPTPEALANAYVSALGRPDSPSPMRARPPAREGMETAVLGSMQSAPTARGQTRTNDHAAPPTLLNAPALAGQVVGSSPLAPSAALVPGTLSGFAATVAASPGGVAVTPPPAVAAATPAPAPSAARVAQHAAPVQRGAAPAAVAAPQQAAVGAPQQAAVGAPQHAAVAAPQQAWGPSGAARSAAVSDRGDERAGRANGAGTTGRRDAISEDSFELPTRNRGRTGLIIVALLAGAISMAGVILLLTWLGRGQGAPERPAPSSATPPSSGAQSPSVAQPPSIAQPPPVAQPPSVAQPPTAQEPSVASPVAVPPPPSAPSEGRSGHRRRPERSSAPSQPGAALPAPALPAAATPRPPVPAAPAASPTTPSELMMEARRAYARGEPEVCSTLVERALAAGAPAIALKLQGDCFRRSGHNADALRSYQRFCRLVPDNPAMSEVRGLAEGLGGSCP